MPRLPAVCAALLMLLPFTHAMAEAPRACASPTQKVSEEGFVRIGGIEQWVTIHGDSCANPVILFVHGGPGNPLSPYAGAIYGAWEKDFTLVQWDQRGAGKTYGKNKPGEDSTLAIDQMTEDGAAVAAYLAQHLGKRKVVLMASSWGSILGVHMIRARPELFHAYVGTSQIVSYRDNQQATYVRVLALARAAGDGDTAAKLEALGAPPWANPRNFGIMRRAVRKYEAMATEPAPKSWWSPAPEYAAAAALADYEAGEDYSFIRFVGMKGDGMFSRVELPALGTAFKVPVFLLQGEQDLLTTPEITRRYFDSVGAPRKELVLVPRAGHDPNQPMVDAQLKMLNERVRTLAHE